MLMNGNNKSGLQGPLRTALCFWLAACALWTLFVPGTGYGKEVMDHVAFFADLKDRSAGTPGSDAAADYILDSFKQAGLTDVGAQEFLTPIPEVRSASLEVNGKTIKLYPWGPNLVYLPMLPGDGLRGPLIYAGRGDFRDFDGMQVYGAIVLMDMASSENWLNVATHGAGAVIFIGGEGSTRGDFEAKDTQTPLAVPRFWVPASDGEALKRLAVETTTRALVKAETGWRNKLVRNCYGLIKGSDPALQKEMVVVDASYDASSHVLGIAPGADEATSVAMLLRLAEEFSRHPPARSVLLVAATGNNQSHDGMRYFIWSVKSKKKSLKKLTNQLKNVKEKIDDQYDLLEKGRYLEQEKPADREAILEILIEKAKDRADALSREIQYRRSTSARELKEAQEAPRTYRQIAMVSDIARLTPEQRKLAVQLLDEAVEDRRATHKELKVRVQAMKSSTALRGLLESYTQVLFFDLHLSSHYETLGLIETGETYPFRESMRKISRAGRLIGLFTESGRATAAETGVPDVFRDTSRGASPDEVSARVGSVIHPASDVASIAGLPAVSLAALDDRRLLWSTPEDTVENMNRRNVETLSGFLPTALRRLFSEPALKSAVDSGVSGLSNLEGQAMFIRQGELFPDQPAPGTIISVLQGDSIFRTMVFRDGTYFIPGLANKRVSLEKLILEPYGVDPATGRVEIAADKTKTGKENYRISVKSDLASAPLIMFRCLQTDILRVFNPQDMGYLTKLELLDASTEAPPLRHWYSRVDGRDTMAVSLFLEKGTRFKLIMSESLLGKEFFLLNGISENPNGIGFLIGEPPTITVAPYHVAKDLHGLLGVRLRNLFQHGIVNVHLEELYQQASTELDQGILALSQQHYGDFWDRVNTAWAKLDIVYAEIESNQRDVLGGVMFFIALFVPFAYCMERYIFCFRSVYQQIIAFFLILVMTILTIRGLHPAFQLTYSPMVVIIAFFIVGLSLLVSSIIFVRFEKEMADLQTRQAHLRTPQASKWQAFGAGFSIGVSNLNRRKLRTGLTCITLIILTFTVMSFTNVKSLHRSTLTRIAEGNPYQGILLRNQFRLPMTMLTLEDMKTRFGTGEASIWPRGWIDPPGLTERTISSVYASGRHVPVEGLLGVGPNAPGVFTRVVTKGRWLNDTDDRAVLLPVAMATRLGLDPEKDLNGSVEIMGVLFTVVGFFDGSALDEAKDLDQNPVTPAYLEVSQGEELSEVEVEAMQMGEELLPQTERFRFANGNRTVILPFDKCIEYGGKLKAISILPRSSPIEIADRLSTWLAFPLFVGENGTWYHSASTTLRYTGVANLLVPILIVIFITLNTMIGHVHERQKEIATYTSVGLAPTHVGFLFIVEALSLAVISTVLGYILAQLSAKYLGNTAMFSQLTFNYSSLASVACMFLVFSVVFLAALYPARLAAQIAMPDVNRSWTLPAPEGDVIHMNLPFLLKSEEEAGIMRFLNAFYGSHQDVAHGSFIVDDINMDDALPPVRPGHNPIPVCIVIRTNAWLAPFDFAIKQRVHLHCCPSDENPGYLEIAIQMTRISGERSAWVRANASFIKALRKQMLVWRLLDEATKAVYILPKHNDAAGLTGQHG